MSMGLARDSGGGFQQLQNRCNASWMVLTCCCASACAQAASDASSSTAAKPMDWLRRRATAAHLMSDATCTFTILSGSVTAPPGDPGGAFLSLSTTSMPDTTSPITVYWPSRLAPAGTLQRKRG